MICKLAHLDVQSTRKRPASIRRSRTVRCGAEWVWGSARLPPHAPPYKLVHVLTHAYLVPEPCAHPRRTSTGRGNHRAAAWRAPVQRYLSAQKGANFDGKKSDSKRGRIRAQRLPTQRGSYPRVYTAQESSRHMVGPRLKGIPTIRSDPPSGLVRLP